ncbi:DUF2065 domain-containing protein [Thiomicrorhabdus sediminis]|uniref:DUF2065 domain-containing protein n=1 Tax=Thiomicrorhabdus sediminis TaxID=2580412 RepID=A0A4P9K5L6_9GAMM|nr:DUF2065 domain-containing protein [Thiomicrorhabdus sediminis]QCU90314.1 DUF2065 domain-containing protein [Thiomicrorhabdus sediminis]
MFESTLIAAIALVFILEGLLPFAFPDLWRKIMAQAILLSERELRKMGLISIVIGLALLLFFSE